MAWDNPPKYDHNLARIALLESRNKLIDSLNRIDKWLGCREHNFVHTTTTDMAGERNTDVTCSICGYQWY